MSAHVRLDSASVEDVAQRVVELLREEKEVTDILLTVAEVARRFGVSRDYVYEHADDLGAFRLGSGPRARLRFDPVVVAERLATTSRGAKTKRRPRRKSADVDLLPIRSPK